MSSTNKPKVVDLFAGVGGLSLGAARAGLEVVLAADKDEHASLMHGKNFPKTHHTKEDLSQMEPSELLKLAGVKKGQIDGVIGGPPCQGFSWMGRRDKNDERNKLFSHFFRLVSGLRPKFFVAENVMGIMDEENNLLREAAFGLLPNDYVILEPLKLKACDYGAATTRTRYFFIGYLKDEMSQIEFKNFLPPKDILKTTVGEALAGLPPKIDPEWQTEEQSWQSIDRTLTGFLSKTMYENIPENIGDPFALQRFQRKNETSGFFGTRHTKEVAARYGKVKAGKVDSISKSRKLEIDGFCPTLRAGTGKDKGSYQAVRPLHPTENRVITPREAARLQGFPDWFQFSPSKWHSFRQIGNSVSPIVAEFVLNKIRSKLS